MQLAEIVRKSPDKIIHLYTPNFIEVLVWWYDNLLIVSYNPNDYYAFAKACNHWEYTFLERNYLTKVISIEDVYVNPRMKMLLTELDKLWNEKQLSDAIEKSLTEA